MSICIFLRIANILCFCDLEYGSLFEVMLRYQWQCLMHTLTNDQWLHVAVHGNIAENIPVIDTKMWFENAHLWSIVLFPFSPISEARPSSMGYSCFQELRLSFFSPSILYSMMSGFLAWSAQHGWWSAGNRICYYSSYSWILLYPIAAKEQIIICSSCYHLRSIITTCHGNAFRIISPLWGKCTSDRWIPSQRPVMCSNDVSLDVSSNKVSNKQFMCGWFETPWGSCHVIVINKYWSHECRCTVKRFRVSYYYTFICSDASQC